jgi:hypothetical protein
MTCDGRNGCGVSYGSFATHTVRWSFDVKPFNWTSGGYQVTEQTGTNNQYECSGGPHNTVCAWYNVAHTAYTVENMVRDCGFREQWHREGDASVIKSPNNNNAGGGHYCVVNTCRDIHSAYWDNNGRFGGP